MENAAKLDPAFLMESVDANHGAPVIDHDNNVLGGNGRAMSIARAYESFPERGEQYREALKAKEEGVSKTILFNLSGNGVIDLYAYEQYLAGALKDFSPSDEEIRKTINQLEHLI